MVLLPGSCSHTDTRSFPHMTTPRVYPRRILFVAAPSILPILYIPVQVQRLCRSLSSVAVARKVSWIQ